MRPLWRALLALLALACPAQGQPPGYVAPSRAGEVAAEEPVGEWLGGDTARFYVNAVARDKASPSIFLRQPMEPQGSVPAAFGPVPVFQRVTGRSTARVDIEPGTSLYGTGEVMGPLLRNGRVVTAWNFDAYGYGAGSTMLYQSHPWVLAVRGDGTAFGVLADTTYRCHIDLSSGIVFIADGPPFPVLVVDGGTPQDVVRRLGQLTGTMPLPPLWALGYHQCRYSYYPEERVREIAHGFRERDIPCDVLWYDIDYMDGYRSFTWSPSFFPDPAGLNADLREMGYHTIAILDPGIARAPGYFVYDQGNVLDAWVKTAAGVPFTGNVWPGECVFPDFTRSDVRAWWGDLCGEFLETGIDGLWNDMNEPAVFDVEGKTMPVDNHHDADAQLGGPGSHARYHNVYGMLMARASFEGMARARPARRPFVLSRAGALGLQRYAATWTGDNTASWEHLDASIPMVLNLGLSAQPFSGPDIGGFARPGTPRMFARWMGIGALLPFARGHTGKGNIDKEPWAFGGSFEATCRRALKRRYRLLPYLYTLFREASTTGLPVCRPAFFAAPADAALRREDDSFLLGADVLVAAATRPEAAPAPPPQFESWRPFDLGVDDATDPDLPRLLLRPGAIVPLGPSIQYVGERPLDPLELLVCLDENGKAAGVLYEDAGEGTGYRQGEYRVTRYQARLEPGAVVVTAVVQEGSWPRPDRQITVRLVRDGPPAVATGSSGGPIRVERKRR